MHNSRIGDSRALGATTCFADLGITPLSRYERSKAGSMDRSQGIRNLAHDDVLPFRVSRAGQSLWVWRSPRVATVVSRALTIAFRSMWHDGEMDPGAGRTFTFQDCPVDEETTQSLFQEWPNIAELACTAAERALRWSDLVKLQDEWRYELRRIHVLGVSDDLRALRQKFADRILQTIATRTQDHPGIQHRVASVAALERIRIKTHTDPHFDAFYLYEEGSLLGRHPNLNEENRSTISQRVSGRWGKAFRSSAEKHRDRGPPRPP